jgi:Tol biopolymer transport system component
LVWYDRGGKLLGGIGGGGVAEPAISPDEKSVVFRRLRVGATADLWLRDLSRETEQRFTITDRSLNWAPFWAPKGDRIAFGSNRDGGINNLYQKAASGSGQDELLLATGNPKYPSQWSHDGRFLVYSELDPRTKYDIWVLPMEGAERKPLPLVRSPFNELHGQLSPDSHWMVYTSDESGQREVYVRPFPSGEGRWRMSIAGGEQPRWRGDGEELFFAGEDGKMMAVPVKARVPSGPGTTPSFEAGSPQPLFETHVVGLGGSVHDYDVTADGKRFLVATESGVTTSRLTVVVNWAAGLTR